MKGYEFCNVTLVSEDDHSFVAYKVILSSNSNFFKIILRNVNNPQPQPLIFMSNMKFPVLRVIIDFIYEAEAKLEPES